MSNLHVCLDLGSDTLKVAFAIDNNGSLSYGKFANPGRLNQIAIPATAFYDDAKKRWYYGDEIDSNGESFLTIVKIKSLLSLITFKSNAKLMKNNQEYYFSKNNFPKFYFPVRRELLDDFGKMVQEDRTFIVEGSTPQSVCKAFFTYVKEIIDKRIKVLAKKFDLVEDCYDIAILHASSVGDEYINELTSIVNNVFAKRPNKVLSSNKALSIYAYQRKMVSSGEPFLVFDMGEEEISVVRAGVTEGKAVKGKSTISVMIDGQEGHMPSVKLGGIDVDEAICNHLESSIYNRETMGTPHPDKPGHIFEGSVWGKQYHLMNDIKKAKVIFSTDNIDGEFFKDGVPINISRELRVQRMLTKEDFKKCIGVTDNDGVAKRILTYIYDEIKKPVNHDIKKIFLSGGLVETYSLLDYIKTSISKDFSRIKVCTFEDNIKKGNDFSILAYEDSVFSPSIGGAIASLKNIEISMVLSLSFAAWVYSSGEKVLRIFAERGDVIEVGKLYSIPIRLQNEEILDEEMFSTFITSNDIAKGNYSPLVASITDNGNKRLIIGERTSRARRIAEEKIGLVTKIGKNKGKIFYKYRGVRVRIVPITKGEGVSALEGVVFDKNGIATPVIKNNSSDKQRVRVQSIRGNSIDMTVYARDVEICTEGLESIKVISD